MNLKPNESKDVEMCTADAKWKLNIFSPDDTVYWLQKMKKKKKRFAKIGRWLWHCKKQKLKVNVSKSKLTVSEVSEVINFVNPYGLGVESHKQCDQVELNWHIINESEYLSLILFKYKCMKGETLDGALQRRKVVSSPRYIVIADFGTVTKEYCV